MTQSRKPKNKTTHTQENQILTKMQMQFSGHWGHFNKGYHDN